MQSDLMSLSKTFTENLFRIPDYQRGYSWGEKQLKDFWADLDQLEAKHNHYTGVLTLEEVNANISGRWKDDVWILESKHYKPFFVVDGQQRLTTSIILIQTILEVVDDDKLLNYDTKDEIRKRYIFLSKDGGISRSYIFGYEEDNPSYEYLKTKIFLERSDKHSHSEETIYTQNLSAAKEFFRQKIENMNHSEIENVYTKVTQHLLFNIFTISEDVDVFVAFETMSNRGKPLSHLELLKNRLIYLSTKFPASLNAEISYEKNKLRESINESWKSAYYYLGKNSTNRLDDDVFLLAQFILYFNVSLPKRNDKSEGKTLHLMRYSHSDGFKDYLLDKVFSTKRLYEPDEKGVLLKIEDIYEYSRDLKDTVKLFYEIHNPKESDFSDDEKIYLDRIERFNDSECSALVVALFKISSTVAERVKFLTQLERLLFLYNIMPYVVEFDLYDMCAWLVSGEESVSKITATLQKICEDTISAKNFKMRIRELGRGNGYYSWKSMRYFLYEYEQSLRVRAKASRNKLSWEEFSKEDYPRDFFTIEHIYPQKGAHQSWRAAFDKFSVAQKNVLKHSLGNLVPLSKAKNSSLSNKPFIEKKGSAVDKVGYMYGCYSEIEVSAESTWTPLNILERGVKLLKFMEKRWGIPLGSDGDKVKLLGLQFVIEKAES